MKILSAIRKLLIRDAVADTAAGYTEYFKNDPDSASRVYSDMDVIVTVLTYGEVLNRASAQTGLADFSREGYAFKEWNTQPDCSGTSYHGGETIANGTTLYAIWVEKTDVVALNHEGAKILYDDLRGHIDEKVDLPGVYDYKSAVPADVVEIYDAVPEKIKQMQIEIAPVQDLHGYDKPWVGGAGKNLWSGDASISKDSSTLYLNIPLSLQAGTYTISGLFTNENTTQNIVRFTFRNDNSSLTYVNLTSNSGSRTSASITLESACTKVYVYGSTSTSDSYALTGTNIQIESGSTATSYEPYSNICPISGFTGCEVTRTGKNLIPNGTNTNNGYVANALLKNDGTIISNNNGYVSEYFRIKSGSIYTCSQKNTTELGINNGSICFYDANKQFIVGSGTAYQKRASFSVIAPDTAVYARSFQLRDESLLAQVEDGSIAHEIEPFGQIYSITFPSGQTVYGGTLTVNADGTGTLVVDRASIVLQNMTSGTEIQNFITIPASNCVRVEYVPMRNIGAALKDYISDAFETGVVGVDAANRIYRSNSESSVRCFITLPEAVTTINEATTYLNEIKPQIVYYIATAIHYTLTAPQIRTILGYNRIYASTGSILSMLYPAERYQTAEQADRERIHAEVDGYSSVLSITDGADNVPMGMQIAIEPVQDKHGLEPYPPGGGKNLYDISQASNSLCSVTNDIATLTTTVNYQASAPFFIPVSSGNYTLSFTGSSGAKVELRQFKSDKTTSTTDTVSVASSPYTMVVSNDETAYIRVLLSNGTGGAGTFTFSEVQVESGSSATSYAPYSNICPITGWTGAEITRTGKNLATTEIEKKGWIITANGETSSSAANYFISKPIEIKSGFDYYESYGQISGSDLLRIGYYNKDLQFISRQASASGSKLVIPENAKYMKYSAKWNEPDQVDIQIEIGSVTEYEPYSGQTYSITFPSSAGTVYGGTLTVNKDGTGELIVNRWYKTSTWGDGSQATTPKNGFVRKMFSLGIGNKYPPTIPQICNVAPYAASFSGYYLHFYANDDNQAFVFMPENTDSDLEIVISGELLTKQTYTLPAPVIRSLLGYNAVWASTGNVLHLDYTADTKSYIDNLFASLTNATGVSF